MLLDADIITKNWKISSFKSTNPNGMRLHIALNSNFLGGIFTVFGGGPLNTEVSNIPVRIGNTSLRVLGERTGRFFCCLMCRNNCFMDFFLGLFFIIIAFNTTHIAISILSLLFSNIAEFCDGFEDTLSHKER